MAVEKHHEGGVKIRPGEQSMDDEIDEMTINIIIAIGSKARFREMVPPECCAFDGSKRPL
jgi:hypothetical protein